MPTLQRSCLSFKDRHPSKTGIPFNEDAYPSKKMPTHKASCPLMLPTLQRCLLIKAAYPSKKMLVHQSCLPFKDACSSKLPTLQRRRLSLKAACPSKKTLVHQSCLSIKAAYPWKEMPTLQAACQEAKHPWRLPVLNHFQQNVNAPGLASSQVIQPSPCKYSRGRKKKFLLKTHGCFVIPAVNFIGASFWVLLTLSLT